MAPWKLFYSTPNHRKLMKVHSLTLLRETYFWRSTWNFLSRLCSRSSLNFCVISSSMTLSTSSLPTSFASVNFFKKNFTNKTVTIWVTRDTHGHGPRCSVVNGDEFCVTYSGILTTYFPCENSVKPNYILYKEYQWRLGLKWRVLLKRSFFDFV